MAELFSQYASGVQLNAGVIAGSANGVSGLNPIVDRLNSISVENGVLASGVSSTGHGSAETPMIVNFVYSSGATPPSIGSVVEGTIFVEYID